MTDKPKQPPIEPVGIREALEKLVEKLVKIHTDSSYQAVWTLFAMHLGPYAGPTYKEELARAQAALAASEQPVVEFIMTVRGGDAIEDDTETRHGAQLLYGYDWPLKDGDRIRVVVYREEAE